MRCSEHESCVGAPAAPDAAFRRILWIALFVNGLMFGVEFIAGFYSRSVSLQADALDFFGDAANYGISLFVLGMSLRARATAALFKGASMGLFGVWVVSAALYRAITGSVPDASVMGITAFVALIANVGVALMLFRYRQGDSNRRSIWLCSRNDAIANVAVILAASGVAATTTGWPDIAVAVVIAVLSLSSAYTVVRLALGERRGDSLSIAATSAISLEQENRPKLS